MSTSDESFAELIALVALLVLLATTATAIVAGVFWVYDNYGFAPTLVVVWAGSLVVFVVAVIVDEGGLPS